ncbi:hypothetical protein C1645_830516 [Glomus cerebriforme]|uniref:Uncharacterized protein n=1 Tax=Glomus cerebriforme TaxID=658196 RepID=A0A397SHA2_9GLOM|nr:hypothetical protein C1645_830516 [Glomus cerebriforme]
MSNFGKDDRPPHKFTPYIILLPKDSENVRNQELLGSVFVLPSGKTLIWKAINISEERGRMINIIPKIESMLEELTTLNISIGAIVSDSALSYATTRKRDFANSKTNNALPIQDNVDELIDCETGLDDHHEMQETISTVEQWNKQLNEWYEILEQEKITQTEEEKDLLVNSRIINNNELLESCVHSAVDENAKWDL